MDQSTEPQHPLTQRIKECLDANMTATEGAQYVGIYDDGYRLIVSLLLIAKHHSRPDIKTRAEKFLAEFDQRGSIGEDFRAAYRFTMGYKVKRVPVRRKSDRGMRRLRQYEKDRIAEFIARTDVSEDDHSELKRIQASIVEDRVLSLDYDKVRKMIITYGEVAKHPRGRNGWRKVNEKTWGEFESLLDRPDVSEADKRLMSQYIDP